MAKNPFGKKADINNPYAIYKNGDWEMRVLKTYRMPKNETGEYDRWLIAAKSPMTYGSWEYGDTYKHEIENNFHLTWCSEEWEKEYKLGAYNK